MLLDPDNSTLRYNLGCSMVSLGDFDAAIDLLAPVMRDVDARRLIWWRTDTDLDPIRDDPRFQALIDRAAAQLAVDK